MIRVCITMSVSVIVISWRMEVTMVDFWTKIVVNSQVLRDVTITVQEGIVSAYFVNAFGERELIIWSLS